MLPARRRPWKDAGGVGLDALVIAADARIERAGPRLKCLNCLWLLGIAKIQRRHLRRAKWFLSRAASFRRTVIAMSVTIGRTTQHLGYALSQRRRKKIEEPFGWAKTVGGMAQTVHRGLDRVRAQFTMTMAACNLARLPKLLAA